MIVPVHGAKFFLFSRWPALLVAPALALLALILWFAPGAAPPLRAHALARNVTVGASFNVEVSSAAPLPRGAWVETALAGPNQRPVWRRLPPAARHDWLVAEAAPRAGEFRFLARVRGARGATRAELNLRAVAPPPSYYGGVLSVAEYGLPDLLSDALRARGFALQSGLAEGAPRLIAIADPRLGGHDVAAQYRQIWRTVAAGTNLALLTPPAQDVADEWPLSIDLVADHGQCAGAGASGGDDLLEGLPAEADAVLRPDLAYALGDEPGIALRNLGGQLLVRAPGGAGYAGCRDLFTFRYGQGLVTITSVPILERAADAYVQRYLMNLLKVAARRPRGEPAPGLASAFSRRLATLANQNQGATRRP